MRNKNTLKKIFDCFDETENKTNFVAFGIQILKQNLTVFTAIFCKKGSV